MKKRQWIERTSASAGAAGPAAQRTVTAGPAAASAASGTASKLTSTACSAAADGSAAATRYSTVAGPPPTASASKAWTCSRTSDFASGKSAACG